MREIPTFLFVSYLILFFNLRISFVSPNSNLCYPIPVPFIFGGSSGDTKIYSMDMDPSSSSYIGSILIGGGSSDNSLVSSNTQTPFIALINNAGTINFAKYYSVESKRFVEDVQFQTQYSGGSKAIALMDSYPLVLMTIHLGNQGEVVSVYKDTYSYATTTLMQLRSSSIAFFDGVGSSADLFAVAMQSPDGYAQLMYYSGGSSYVGYRSTTSGTYFSSIYHQMTVYWDGSRHRDLQMIYVNGALPAFSMNAVVLYDEGSSGSGFSYGTTSKQWTIEKQDYYQVTQQDSSSYRLTNMYVFSCSNPQASTALTIHFNIYDRLGRYQTGATNEAHFQLNSPFTACLSIDAKYSSQAYFLFQGAPKVFYICFITAQYGGSPSPSCTILDITNLASTISFQEGTAYSYVSGGDTYANGYIAGYVSGISDTTHLSTSTYTLGFVMSLQSTQSCQTNLVTTTQSFTFSQDTVTLSSISFPPTFTVSITKPTGTATSIPTANLVSTSNCFLTPLPVLNAPTPTNPYSYCSTIYYEQIAAQFTITQSGSSCIDSATLLVTMELVDANGNLVNGGSLPTSSSYTSNKILLETGFPSGMYYFKLTGTPNIASLASKSATFFVAYKSCNCRSLTQNLALVPTQYYQVNSVAFNSVITQFYVDTTDTSCAPTLTYSSIPALPANTLSFVASVSGGSTTFNANLYVFSSSESDAGTYTVTITSTYYTTTRTKTFLFVITRSCSGSILTLTPYTSLPVTFSYDVSTSSPQSLLTFTTTNSLSTCIMGTLAYLVSDSTHFSISGTIMTLYASWTAAGTASSTVTVNLIDSLGTQQATATSGLVTVIVTNQCMNNNIVTGTISDQSYEIGIDSTLTFNFADFTIESASVPCPSFSYSVVVANGVGNYYTSVETSYGSKFIKMAEIGTTRTFQFSISTTSLSNAYSSYTVTVTGSMSNGRSGTVSFQLDMKNGCPDATYEVAPATQINYAYLLRGGTQIISITPVFTSDVANSICGTFSFSLLQDWGPLNSQYFSYSSGSLTVTPTTILPSSCGTQPVASCVFQFQVQGYQGTYSGNAQPTQATLPAFYYIQITITDPCIGTSFSPSTATVASYVVSSTKLQYPFGWFSATANSGNCGGFNSQAIAYSSDPSSTHASVIIYPGGTGMNDPTQVDVYTVDTSLSGNVYSFSISASLTDYAAFPGYTASVTFTITLTNPCLTALYTPGTITTTSYSFPLRSSQQTVTGPIFTSSQPDSFCGAFKYLVAASNTQGLEATFFAQVAQASPNVISLNPSVLLPSGCSSGSMPYASCSFPVAIRGYQGTYSSNIQPTPATTTFTITLTDPCVPAVFAPSTISYSYSYIIGDPSYTYQFNQIVTTSNSGSCGGYSIYSFNNFVGAVSGLPAFTYPSGNSGLTDVNLGVDIYTVTVSQAGIYSFTISRGLSDYAAYPAYTHTLSFTMTLVDPCLTAMYTRLDLPIGTPRVYSYNVRDPQVTLSTLPDFTSSVSDTLCGSFTYKFRKSESGQLIDTSIFSHPASSKILSFQSNAILPSGCTSGSMPYSSCTFNIEFRGYQGSYTGKMYPPLPANAATDSYLQVIVNDPCVGTGITPTGSFTYSYNIGGGLFTYTFSAFSAVSNSNNCGLFTTTLTFTSSHPNQNSIITYSNASPSHQFDILSTTLSDAGTIDFYITATLADYAAYSGYSSNIYFTITMVDPCHTAIYSITLPTPIYYAYYIKDPTLTTNSAPIFTSNWPNSLCGDFSYQAFLTNQNPLNSSYISFDSVGRSISAYFDTYLPAPSPIRSVTFDVTIKGHQGTYTDNIQPSVWTTVFFTIEIIDTCFDATITPTFLQSNVYFYIVKDTKLPTTFNNFTVTDELGNTARCSSLEYSLSFQNLESQAQQIFNLQANSSENLLEIFTENQLYGAMYIIQVVGTMPYYMNSNHFTQYFPICSIILPIIQPITYFVTNPSLTTSIAPAYDYKISQCPVLDYSFTLNNGLSIDENVFTKSMNNKPFTDFITHSNDPGVEGTYDITLTAAYRDYVYRNNFIVTIYCNVLSMTLPILAKQTYNIGNPKLTYTFQQYTQIPACRKQIVYTVKQSNGKALPTFVTFEPSSRSFLILSIADTDQGIYEFKITATVNNGDGTIFQNQNGKLVLFVNPNPNSANETSNSTNSTYLAYLEDIEAQRKAAGQKKQNNFSIITAGSSIVQAKISNFNFL